MCRRPAAAAWSCPLYWPFKDTTDLDFTGHPATQGLGYLERSHLRGIKVHSILAASESGVPQGLLPQRVWVRDDAELGKKHARHTQATRDKESRRWLDALGDPGGLADGSLPRHGG